MNNTITQFTVTFTDNTTATFINQATIVIPVTPTVTEVDVVEGANTQKFIPDTSADASVSVTSVTN